MKPKYSKFFDKAKKLIDGWGTINSLELADNIPCSLSTLNTFIRPLLIQESYTYYRGNYSSKKQVKQEEKEDKEQLEKKAKDECKSRGL